LSRSSSAAGMRRVVVARGGKLLNGQDGSVNVDLRRADVTRPELAAHRGQTRAHHTSGLTARGSEGEEDGEALVFLAFGAGQFDAARIDKGFPLVAVVQEFAERIGIKLRNLGPVVEGEVRE